MATYIDDIRQGDTRVFQIDYGKGVDITGWKFYFILRVNFDDSSNYLQVMTTAGDHADDDVLNGLAHLTLPSTITAGIEPGKYYYAIKVDKGGTPSVIKTLVPPISEPKDRVEVIDGMEIE